MELTLYLPPHTKKNSSRIVKVKGHYIIMPSKIYKDYEKECGQYIPECTPIESPVNIKCIYYMPTRRRVDITNLLEATDDMLVHYQVIKDDNRDIVAGHDGSRVYYSKENPRTEIYITPMEGYEKWQKPTTD